MIRRWCVTVGMCGLLAVPIWAQEQDTQGAKGKAADKEARTSAAEHESADSLLAAPSPRLLASPAPERTGGFPSTPFPRSPFPAEATNGSEDAPGRIVPRFELSAGYSYVNFNPGDPFNSFNNHGGSGSFTYNPARYVGLTAEFTGYNFTRNVNGTNVNGGWNTWLFGPRLNMRRFNYFVPFAEFLLGGSHGDRQMTGDEAQNRIALAAGGGVDVVLTKNIAWRFAQIDFLRTDFFGANLGSDRHNQIRFGTGLVIRFGLPSAPPPPPAPKGPPVAACQANPASVFAESNDTVTVHVNAGSPDNLPLTYSYTATGGAVDGTGPDARWNSSGVKPGSYTVTVKVDDGKGGTASCAVDITVEERPHHPPTLSCSANPTSIRAGDKSTITCNGASPDNLPLTFEHTAAAGQVTGNGPTAVFDSKGLDPGTYTVNTQVTDSRGDKAQASTNIEVTRPAPPAEQVRLETRLALHSVYFPTAQPTAANPNGGLTPSQAQTLDALANDFRQYLTYRPEAQLILEGHADIRGSKEYNDKLSQRRVERVRSYLVEKGAPADHIETRAYGFEKNMSSDEVRKLIEADPDLSPVEKQRLIRNLLTVRLANNRRVDVTLSTTGEQSVRKFPFNARDALTLLSRTGPGTTAKKKTPAPKKTNP